MSIYLKGAASLCFADTPGPFAAVYRHVNGLMLDDAIYAADMLLRLSAGQEALWTQAAWHSLADAPAACWYAPPHHHLPLAAIDECAGGCRVRRLLAGRCCGVAPR